MATTRPALTLDEFLALAYAREGAKIVVNDLDREPSMGHAAEVASLIGDAGGEVEVCLGDASDTSDMERVIASTVERFGRLDILVNNANPGRRDPNGVHAAIWEEVEDEPFRLPPDKPLTLVAYECELITRAYIEPVAVGDVLPDMPLFLVPNGCVKVPLEVTYQTAFSVMPVRWRRILEGPTPR